MGSKKLLFLTLKIFSATGGIEKVCKIAGRVFYEYFEENNGKLFIYAMHDKNEAFNSKYFPFKVYKAFNANKFLFGVKTICTGLSSDVIILSHSNLLFFGNIIKLVRPSVQLVLFAHGIEVWKPFSKLKSKWLKKCNIIN